MSAQSSDIYQHSHIAEVLSVCRRNSNFKPWDTYCNALTEIVGPQRTNFSATVSEIEKAYAKTIAAHPEEFPSAILKLNV